MKKYIVAFLIISTLSAALNNAVAVAAHEEYPHYLAENHSRYEAYRARNPRLPYDMVIAYVNADVDKGFYSEISTVAEPESISVLVNKNFILPRDYEPDDLVSLGGGYRLRAEAAERLSTMRTDMNNLGYRIYVMSAYRTYQSQLYKYNDGVRNYGREFADTQYARPGHSEHQTGLAVDIVQRTNIRYMTQARFENTEEFAWLRENAYKYGFILRYPREYTDIHGFIYEPWHWRYVGVDIATAMHNESIIMFEEYYGRHLAPGVLAKIESERAQQRK